MASKFVTSILWFGGCSLLGYVLLIGCLNNQENKMKTVLSDKRYQQHDTKNSELLMQVLQSSVRKKSQDNAPSTEEKHNKTEN